MRTSNSCTSCAKRKRKCDLSKPACSRCIRLKIVCQWPVQKFSIKSLSYSTRETAEVIFNKNQAPLGFNAECDSSWQARLPLPSVSRHYDKRVSNVRKSKARKFSRTFGSHSGTIYGKSKSRWLQKSQPILDWKHLISEWSSDSTDRIPLMSESVSPILSLFQVNAINHEDFTNSVPIPAAIISVAGPPCTMQSEEPRSQLLLDGDANCRALLDENMLISGSRSPSPKLSITTSVTEIPQSIITREDSYSNLFFAYFCGEFSILAGKDFWRRAIPTFMQTSPGIKHTVLAVAAMFAHRSYAHVEAANESWAHYDLAVRGIQENLDVNSTGPADSTTIVGVTLLMVFELISGNVAGYHIHLRALSQLIYYSGAERCKHGLHSLVLLTMAVANINHALLHDADTFLADEAWRRTLQAILPARFALVVSAYARAARSIYRQVGFSKGSQTWNHVLYLENQNDALVCLQDLQGMYAGYALLGFPMEAPDAALYPLLSQSPFQPSMILPDLRMSSNFPMLVAVMLRLHVAFGIRHDDEVQLINQLVQVAQYIIVSNENSATLLGQVWALIIAKRFIQDRIEREWLETLERLIELKGFGIARS